ncbi:MAG TPA: protein kinase [Bryobacteraceae bacterium]|nr:protein kinase [Bryobacteraceae bacterium]
MIGTEIANYRILEKLGEGGMGVVYKGVDIALDRPVAIKVLSDALANNPELVERFRAEARAQANLNHTNLATLYTFVIQNGSACMVMEFVDGETFENMILRRGPIPALEAVPLFKQAMLGIGFAHRAGIVHRDIKPANLMVNRMGIVKVMDFGIAKVMGARGMTKTGTQMGTGWYMSPEQVLNKAVDIRSDIYSLGVTLYQMLSAHVPFEGASEFEIMSGHLQTPPPLPTRFYPYIPKGLENAVLKALEKNPDNRFQTVEEFGAALEHPDDFAFAPATAAPDRPVQNWVPVSPPTTATVPMDRTATMIAMPAGGIPQTPAPVAQTPPPVQKPASPLLATRQSKILAGGGALAAVLLVGWFTLRGPSPAPAPSLPSQTTPHANTPTPLEQQLSSPAPAAAQMSTTTTQALKVDSFLSDSSAVTAGQRVHLSWSVSGASEVTITPGIGTVKAQGGVDVPLAKTTEFVLTAKDEGGQTITRSARVAVSQVKAEPPPAQVASRVPTEVPAPKSTPAAIQPPVPPVPPPPSRIVPSVEFNAVPDTIPAGGAAMLRWNLTNAQSATLQPSLGVLRQAVGQVYVRPTETTIYTLTAVSKDGSSATSTVTVQVQQPAQPVRPVQQVQPGRPVQPPVQPGAVVGLMVHDHGATFGQNNVWNRCWGQMQVLGDHLQYRVIGTTDGRRDDFDVPLNQVQEAAANRLPIRTQPAFHVTIGGQHFNFVPQGTSVAQAISVLHQRLQGR